MIAGGGELTLTPHSNGAYRTHPTRTTPHTCMQNTPNQDHTSHLHAEHTQPGPHLTPACRTHPTRTTPHTCMQNTPNQDHTSHLHAEHTQPGPHLAPNITTPFPCGDLQWQDVSGDRFSRNAHNNLLTT